MRTFCAGGSPQIIDYAVTKGAIRTFTQALAKELTKRGIRVNGVAPGPIWTPLIPQPFGEEKVRRDGESAPLERAGQPAEVAPVYVFLASDESRHVSGEIVGVAVVHRSSSGRARAEGGTRESPRASRGARSCAPRRSIAATRRGVGPSRSASASFLGCRRPGPTGSLP